jgi:hypothetical protein
MMMDDEDGNGRNDLEPPDSKQILYLHPELADLLHACGYYFRHVHDFSGIRCGSGIR